MPVTQNYSDVTVDVQRVLTLAEVAAATGVKTRQVSNWAAGSSRPRGVVRNRLLSLRSMVERLEAVLKPEGIDIWLHSPNRNLEWKAPLDLLAEGRFDAVGEELDQLTEAVH